MAGEPQNTPPTAQPDYSGRIVVGTDGTPTAGDAVAWAAARASRLGLPLTVLMVVPELPRLSRGQLLDQPHLILQVIDRVRVRAEAAMADLAVRLRSAHPGLDVATEVVVDEPAHPLALATDTADLVVIGSRGASAPGLSKLFGGVSGAVTHGARRPVVVVPEDADPAASGPVVVGVDDSSASREAVRLAVAEASALGVGIVAVHTWEPIPWPTDVLGSWVPEDRRLVAALDEMVRGIVDAALTDHPEVGVRYVLEAGHPAPTLQRESAAASLVVVGTRGRGGFAGLILGSTSREVMRHARCPVLVAHAPAAPDAGHEDSPGAPSGDIGTGPWL